jgi:hypothetical protein
MNFSWNTSVYGSNSSNNSINSGTDLIDVRGNFRKLTEEFCKFYYSTYDNNFPELENIYKYESIFTYLDEEFTGFSSVLQRIKQYNIYRFTHHTLHINAQPVGDRTILINVDGTISINDSSTQQKFDETIILQRDNENHFSVYHTIFKLID